MASVDAPVRKEHVGGDVFPGADPLEETLTLGQHGGQKTQRIIAHRRQASEFETHPLHQTEETDRATAHGPDQRFHGRGRKSRIAFEHGPIAVIQQLVEQRQFAPGPQVLGEAPIRAIENDREQAPLAVGRSGGTHDLALHGFDWRARFDRDPDLAARQWPGHAGPPGPPLRVAKDPALGRKGQAARNFYRLSRFEGKGFVVTVRGFARIGGYQQRSTGLCVCAQSKQETPGLGRRCGDSCNWKR